MVKKSGKCEINLNKNIKKFHIFHFLCYNINVKQNKKKYTKKLHI